MSQPTNGHNFFEQLSNIFSKWNEVPAHLQYKPLHVRYDSLPELKRNNVP